MASATAAPRLYLNDYSSPVLDHSELILSGAKDDRTHTTASESASSQASSSTPGHKTHSTKEEQDQEQQEEDDDMRLFGSSTGSSPQIDPASIPTRTSSTRAVSGSKTPKSPKSPRSPTILRSPSSSEKHTNGFKHRHTQSGTPIAPIATHPAMRSVPEDRQHPSSTHQPTSPPSNTTTAAPQTPPPTKNPPLGNDLIHAHTPTWSAAKEKILFGPYDYLYGHPGKDIRQRMISAFNAWLHVPPASLATITKVIGMLHTASLLIDDVEDSSHLRRGVPVAHAIFGTAQTINSANYVYFMALQELQKLEKSAACVQIYTEELLNLHRGQGMDLFWRDTLTCPSEADYLEMVHNKTGGLFRLAIKLMCAESPSHQAALQQQQAQTQSPTPHSSQAPAPDYIPLANTTGLLFQILDDYKNLAPSPTFTHYQTQKNRHGSRYEDLTEGKFSFPVIHAIRADPSNLVLVNILKQRTEDDEVKSYAVAYMRERGSFAYTRRVLGGLVREALGLCGEVEGGRGGGEGMKGILKGLGMLGEEGEGEGEAEGERERERERVERRSGEAAVERKREGSWASRVV